LPLPKVYVDESIRVLGVEDEESYRQALASGLGREGFVVEVAGDGAEALRLFADHPPDIVLLDMLLPGMHGIEVCRRMRSLAPVPIVMVSAVDSELDVVLGLELGAAGYVTKPFRLRELVARMQAILRRVSPPEIPPLAVSAPDAGPTRDGSPPEPRPDVAFGSVTVDFVRREVTVDGTKTHLSRREFDLLEVLLTPVRRVRTRDELIDLLWPDRYLSDSRTLDTHIHRLRAKLEPDPADPQFIVTVRGVGFRIDPDSSQPAPPTRKNLDDAGGEAQTGPDGQSGRDQPVTA
jgi:two-component system, OmpR family, response regulator RegX3